MTTRQHESLPLTFRRIQPEEAAPLRHAVLWPMMSEDEQITASDRTEGALHFGAFLADPVSPSLLSAVNVESPLYLPLEARLQTEQHNEGSVSILQRPIATVAFTSEHIASPGAEHSIEGAAMLPHVQLHKFAVLASLQRRGIGRRLYEAVLTEWRRDHVQDGSFFLHCDARDDQQQMYVKLGFQVVNSEIFLKYGPTGNAPGIKYIRMARICTV